MSSSDISKTYFAVIFTSQRTTIAQNEYEKAAERMLQLAKEQDGFLGVESVRGSDGFGITISYWDSEENIRKWKSNEEHFCMQQRGRSEWYESFTTRICRVSREYKFEM